MNIIGTKSDLEAMARNLSQTVLIEYTRDFSAPIEKGEVMGTMTCYPTDGGSPVVYDLIAGRTIQRRDNAPLTLEEIEAEVKADPESAAAPVRGAGAGGVDALRRHFPHHSPHPPGTAQDRAA